METNLRIHIILPVKAPRRQTTNAIIRIQLDLTAMPGVADGLHQVHYDDPNHTGGGAILKNGPFHARATAYDRNTECPTKTQYAG